LSTTTVKDVLASVLPECIPTAREAATITAVAQEAMSLVKEKVTPEMVSDVVFGGSFAKRTWLRGDADIDIFVKVRPGVDEKTFEQLGVKIGTDALKKYRPHLRYSDHPYVEAFIRGVRINVVPCYDVERGKWKSAADRSPYHTLYVMQALDDEKKSQVRLLKRFFKSAGIYGAEISTGGFSGYVSEVLVARYGSLEGVLQAAAAGFGSAQQQQQQQQQKQPIVIAVNNDDDDGGGSGGYDQDVVKGFTSPLVIIDPVDPRRNLGTAISPESAGTFILAARAFLAGPSAAFFSLPRKRQAGRINKKLYPLVLVAEFSHRKRSPDTIWGQLKRSAGSLAKRLELAGFTVFRYTYATNEETSGVFAFLLESLALPPYTVRKGPEVLRRNDSASFISKAMTSSLAMWVDREMRVCAVAERKETDAKKLLRELLGEKAQSSGVARDMITGKLKVYSASQKKLGRLAKGAVDELVSTESIIFFGSTD